MECLIEAYSKTTEIRYELKNKTKAILLFITMISNDIRDVYAFFAHMEVKKNVF